MQKKTAFSLFELAIVITIIAILIAGTFVGESLIKKSRITSAQNLTAQSPVNSIEGLVIWYESTSEKSFVPSKVEDGSKIKTWNNIAPNQLYAVNAIQTNSASQPLYQENVFNSLPLIYFNGSAYLEAAYNPDFNPSKVTIFTVINAKSTTDIYGTVISTRNDSPAAGYGIYSTASGYQFWIGNSSGSGASSSVTIKSDNLVLLSATNDGSNSNFYSNGALVTTNSAALVANNSLPFRIGAGNNAGAANYFFNGYVGEIIVFNRLLKIEERKSVEKYLSDKWKVQLNS